MDILPFSNSKSTLVLVALLAVGSVLLASSVDDAFSARQPEPELGSAGSEISDSSAIVNADGTPYVPVADDETSEEFDDPFDDPDSLEAAGDPDPDPEPDPDLDAESAQQEPDQLVPSDSLPRIE